MRRHALARRLAPLWRPRGDGWLFAALCLLIALLPWPLGSNRAWTVCALVLAIALLLTLAWAQTLAAGRSPIARLRPAAWPLGALGLFALLVLLQWLGGLRAEQAGLIGTVDPWQTLHYLVSLAKSITQV